MVFIRGWYRSGGWEREELAADTGNVQERSVLVHNYTGLIPDRAASAKTSGAQTRDTVHAQL